MELPRLWKDTIETHRREVRQAIQQATAALVAEQGLRAVTMSEIAARTGIGRATLYKYFPDVEAILFSWHDEQVAAHLVELDWIRHQPGPPLARLRALLRRYAGIQYSLPDHEVSALVHPAGRSREHEQQLLDLFVDLLDAAVDAGEVRTDLAPAELAAYCVAALGTARSLHAPAETELLAEIVASGLRPPS